MKIAIGIPSGDMVHADFAVSLACMVSFALSKGVQVVGIINEKASIIEKARHTIVEQAMTMGADAIFFLDTDMVFPPDTLVRLLEADKAIIGCNYSTRRQPYQMTCRNEQREYVDPLDRGVRAVGFIATGCLLINLDIFRKLGKPYFEVKWNAARGWFDGEDYVFCQKARDKGCSVFCDFDLSREIQHIGTVNVKV